MTIRKTLAVTAWLVLSVGCATTGVETAEPDQAPDEPTSTVVPSPTFTAEEREPITRADELAGVWFSLKGGLYLLFSTEGYFAASTERIDLQSSPPAYGNFRFEDGMLYIEHLALWESMVDFVGSTNSYTVMQLPDDTIQFAKVDAPFEVIANALAGDSGVAVYYHLVD